MPSVDIVEVAPRDGLQNESAVLATDQKIDLIRRCIAAGLRRIEAVSFAHPARVPQMADAEAVMQQVPRDPGVSYIGLVMNERGLDRALASRVDEVNFVVVATETFSHRNQGVGVASALAGSHKMVQRAREAGLQTSVTIAAAFGCPFEGEVAESQVLDIFRQVVASAPDEIALADTIGVGVPAQVRGLLRGARALAPETRMRLHLHNTRNTGIANALAAVDEQVSALDASVGGIGGCPFAPAATGNIGTEDLVYALQRSGLETGVDGMAAARAGAWIAEELGLPKAAAALGRAGWFPPP